MLLYGIGLEVPAADFPRAGRIALKLLSSMRSASRERLIFGGLRRQAALQRLLGGPRMLAIRYTRGPLSGLGFRCGSAEKYFLVGADFESALLPVIYDTLTETSVVYDVGAHAGYWSLAFARLCPSGAIYAFEPSPINYARLALNTAATPGIHRIPAAVSDKSGSATFHESGSISRIRTDGEIKVPRLRLDDLNLSAPGLLKMDIEGHAGAALAGAIGLVRRARPAILCEIHDTAEREAVNRILGDLGYGVTTIEQPHHFPFHVFAKYSRHNA